MIDSHDAQILYLLFVKQDNALIEQYRTALVYSCLKNASADDIWSVISSHSNELIPVDSSNIPQYSSIDDMFKVLQVLIDSPEDAITRETIGYYLCKSDSKSTARIKYGENHFKIAAQLGLAEGTKNMQVTNLGFMLYLMESRTEKMDIVSRLAFRIPIIQQALLLAEKEKINLFDYLRTYLSYSTSIRRRSNAKALLKFIDSISTPNIRRLLLNIVWEDEENDFEGDHS